MTGPAGDRDRGGYPPLHRYEMTVRTVLDPAVVASFPVPTERIVVPRCTVRRLHVEGDRDVGRLLQRLGECGVEVLELRVVDRAA